MNVGHYVAWFFGGAFTLNALPHIVAASGARLPEPVRHAAGQGLSSSTVNVRVGLLQRGRRRGCCWCASAASTCARRTTRWPRPGRARARAVRARHFGRFNGGDLAQQEPPE